MRCKKRPYRKLNDNSADCVHIIKTLHGYYPNNRRNMKKVYISIDSFTKKMNVLFAQADGDVNSASVFPLPIRKGCVENGYCHYSEIFDESLIELLRLNGINEADISIAVPSMDVCMDYITVPNLGSNKKNDDNFFQELKKMFPFLRDFSDISTGVVRQTKSSTTYRYSMFGAENFHKISEYLFNTNHELSFITSNVIASASMAMTLAGGKSFFSKDIYHFVNMKKSHTECALVSGNEILATHCIPFGLDLLKGYTAKDFINYKLFNEIEERFAPLKNFLDLYMAHCGELSLPDPKRIVYLVPREYENLSEFLNHDTDYPWVALEIPEQYKAFANNLELLGMFMSKVDKSFNFASQKPVRPSEDGEISNLPATI